MERLTGDLEGMLDSNYDSLRQQAVSAAQFVAEGLSKLPNGFVNAQ